MKKLVALILVLGLATVANAGLTLVSTDMELSTSETAIISIDSAGDVSSQQEFYLNLSGPGLLDVSAAINLINSNSEGASVIDIGALGDPPTPGNFIFMDLAILGGPPAPPVTAGTGVVGNIVLTCQGMGDVTLTLSGSESGELSSLVITQIPEPITLALLGLGGLFIRRK